jgi:hypothetical protein
LSLQFRSVKPQPTYPRDNSAKRFNASGPVEAQGAIGITGRRAAAKAIKGHPLLREAAVNDFSPFAPERRMFLKSSTKRKDNRRKI